MIEHPGAQDSFEGIVQWWILERSLKAWLPVITEAVAELVEQGLLERRATSNGTVLYRMNPARIEELQDLLRKYNGFGEASADER